MSIDEILKVLPKLSVDELLTIRGRIAYLLPLKGVSLKTLPAVSESPPAAPSNSDTDLVLEQIDAYLRGKAIEFTTVQLLRASPQFRSFRDKVPGVMTFIRNATTERNEQRLLLDLAIDLLYRYLIKRGLPVGGRILMQQIHRVPDVINAQFPGYAQAGMLPMIVRRENHNVRHE